MKKRLTLLRFILILSVIMTISACGGGGGGGGAESNSNSEFVSLDDADAVFEALIFALNGNNGEVVVGVPPIRSVSINAPIVSSFPDVILTNRGSNERIDIVFQIQQLIEEVYVRVVGSTKYVQLNEGGNPNINNESESISLIIGLSDDLGDGDFCVEISTKDQGGLVSDTAEVCFTLSNQEGDERVVHFADFSSNSTLSTLNFDNGDVNNIGPTGFSLTDIAFLDGRLYGVTSRNLVEIDRDTGVGILVGSIGSIGSSGVNALEGRDGNLYAATASGQFLTIDPTTGLGSEISLFDSNAGSSGDLVFDKDGLKLFGTVKVAGSITDQLIEVNPKTGEMSFLGETGFNDVWGLVFFRNQLLGLTRAGEFIILNPATGVGTLVEETDAFSAGGASAE